jgi:hypothetical protein
MEDPSKSGRNLYQETKFCLVKFHIEPSLSLNTIQCLKILYSMNIAIPDWVGVK